MQVKKMLEELLKINRLKRTVTVALLLLSSTATGSSPNAPEGIARSHVIHFTREDLAKPSGVEHLYRRIVLAARSVCGYVDAVNIRQSPEYEQCYEHAVDDAVTSVGSSALTALHRDRTRY